MSDPSLSDGALKPYDHAAGAIYRLSNMFLNLEGFPYPRLHSNTAQALSQKIVMLQWHG